MNVLVSTRDMSREEWLAWRRRGIGGSDAAAIWGLHPYKSALQVYLEKIGEITEEEAGEAAYWGTVLEDVVAREFSLRTGLKVQRRNAILAHPQYPWMIANVDRFVLDPQRGRGVLECKTASAYRADEWEGDRIPDHYAIQVHHYLTVTGLSYGYIAVLVGGNRFRYKLIERDEEICRMLIEREREFWQLVESRTPPPLDGSPAASDLLDLLYPAESTRPQEITLPPTALDLIAEYEAAKAEAKAAATRAEEAANKLKAMLGEFESGAVGDRRVIWKTITSERLDTKAFKAEHPDLAARYLKPTTYRRFEVK